MDQPIIMPRLVRQFGNMQAQKAPISDGGNSFLAGSLVVISSAVLAAVATAGVLVYGWSPDESKTATQKPPDSFFGENHYPFTLDESAELEMNVGTISTNALVVGAANSAVQQSSAVIGTSYGIGRATTGTYSGYQVVDTSNTTNLVFTVVGFPDNTAAADYNGLVRVKIVKACLQA